MEITELSEIILSKDQAHIKKWCRHHLLDIITTYKSSNLSQADFATAVNLEAKYFYSLIGLARKEGLLPRSKLGLNRMNKYKKKKAKKPLFTKDDFKEVSLPEMQAAPRSLIRLQTKAGLQIEVEGVASAIEIIRAITC